MSQQSSTTNLGSLEKLYQALLGSGQSVEPFLYVAPIPGVGWQPGGGWIYPPVGVYPRLFDATSGPPPAPHEPPSTPHPGGGGGWHDPIAQAGALVLSGIALKQVAAKMPALQAPVGQALTSAADQAMSDWEDDYCGTPPRPLPTLALAVSLAAFASTLQAGGLQTAIQHEASRIAQRAFAPAQQAGSPASVETP